MLDLVIVVDISLLEALKIEARGITAEGITLTARTD